MGVSSETTSAQWETLLDTGNAGLPGVEESGVKHNVYHWDEIYANDNFFKGGWAGQGLLVNPTWNVVAVFTSYFKEDQSEVRLEEKVFEVVNGVFGPAEK